MRRGILILATLAIALLAGSAEPARAQTTVMRIDPAWKWAALGSGPFSVQVWVDDVVTTDPCPLVGGGPCGLGGYEVEIAFDPTVIAFQSFANGPFLSSTGRTLYMCATQTIRHDPAYGVLSYYCATTGSTPLGPEGSGHLATVTFEPVSIGTTDLHLQNTQLVEASPFGTDIPHTTQDGSVTVQELGEGDSDGDGCANVDEAGDDPALGGDRNWFDPHDFYDVPVPTAFNGGTLANRDKAISIINDVLAVLEYSGTSDDGPPNAAGRDYDQDNNGDGEDDGILYDRSVGVVWSGAPEGAITIIVDVLLVLAQSGHSCQTPP